RKLPSVCWSWIGCTRRSSRAGPLRKQCSANDGQKKKVFVFWSRRLESETSSTVARSMPRLKNRIWEMQKARQVFRAFLVQSGDYFNSLLGDAVNSFGLAIGRAVRLTRVGAPAAA